MALLSTTRARSSELYVDSSATTHGFLYSGGTYTTLDDPLSDGSSDGGNNKGTISHSINDLGQIVGFYVSGQQDHGFLYSGGTFTSLNDPFGTDGTAAYGSNDAGQIVGEYFDGSNTEHGFVYSNGTYTTLDDPLGTKGTAAWGINDMGQIVGYYIDSSGVNHGFLYSGGTYTTIDNAFGTGTFLYDINDAGEIVGQYLDSSGTYHSFLASPLALTSPPATSVQAEVLGLYMALYNRAADFPGYSYWVGIDSGQPDSGGVTVANASTTAVTLSDAAVLGQAFVNTQNTFFNSLYGNLTDSQFINALYLNIGGSAGDPGGIAYWGNLLTQAEASGESMQAARAGLVGQFVHDLVDINLAPGAAALGLTGAQYQAAVQRQEAIIDKIEVSLAYGSASQQPGGAILIAQAGGDAAYNAAVTVLQNVTSDPGTITTAITGINNAVAHQDLTLI